MRIFLAFFASIGLPAAPQADNRSSSVPIPDSVFGFAPGADYKLATYDQSIEYFKKLAAASRSIKLFEAGTTTQGRTMYFALISTPENPGKDDGDPEILHPPRHAPGLAAPGGPKTAV